MKSPVTIHGYPMGLKDPVSLDDTVWTILHIALFLGQKPDTLNSVVNSYGFPLPLTNQKRKKKAMLNGIDICNIFEKSILYLKTA